MYINSDQVDGRIDRRNHVINLLLLYNGNSILNSRLTLSKKYVQYLVIEHFNKNRQDILDSLNHFYDWKEIDKLSNFDANKFLSNFSSDLQLGIVL